MALNFQQSGSASVKRVLLVVLLVVSFALTTLYAREGESGPLHTVQNALSGLVAPFKFVGAATSAGTAGVGEAAENITADESTLSALRDTNAELNRRLAQADEYKQEAERLQGLLNMKDSSAIDGVAARVVGKSIEAWNQTISLDAGKADGIASGMTVMGASGVVGQVVSVEEHTAQVRLLTDPQSGAAAIIQSSRGEGIVRGSLEGLLYLENIDEANLPQQGDVIVTSGLGGSYVRGLLIGRVVRVDQTKGNAMGRIVVAPNDGATPLEEVIVVKGLLSDSGDDALSASPSSTPESSSGETKSNRDGGNAA